MQFAEKHCSGIVLAGNDRHTNRHIDSSSTIVRLVPGAPYTIRNLFDGMRTYPPTEEDRTLKRSSLTEKTLHGLEMFLRTNMRGKGITLRDLWRQAKHLVKFQRQLQNEGA